MSIFQITLQPTGRCFSCKSEEHLLHGLHRAGISLVPIGCREGGCGLCLIQVNSGSYQLGPMSKKYVDSEKAIFLACRVFPRSDMEIQVPPK